MAVFAIAFVFFFVFCIYVCYGEHNDVYEVRKIEPYEVIDDYIETVVEDPSAPVGIKNEYNIKLKDISITKDYLAFYTVHQYVDVYMENQLIYSLRPSENNRFADSTSSNWTFIPLNLSDNGKDITVVITPIFNGVKKRSVDFLLGARSTIMVDVIRADLPQIIIAGICIVIGGILMIVNPLMILLKRISSWQMFYLGSLLLLIGAWRITDARCSPLIFSKKVIALGYVSLAALFLICAPLLLFLQEKFTGIKKKVLLVNLLLVSAIALGAFVCQVFGIAELRDLLELSHMVILATVAIIFMVILSCIGKNAKTVGPLLWMLIPMLVGVLVDFSFYCIKKSSSGLLFTSSALLIYTVIRFINEMLKINKKINIDALTGLSNRNKWIEIIKTSTPGAKATGIIMFDLNGLKTVNDTVGHNMGDRMVKDFAGILCEVFPSDCFVFRWGGDEFTVLVPNADEDKMNGYISEVSEKTRWYNENEDSPEISFAVGCAASKDFPNLSYTELLKRADARMYSNKSEWYDKNGLESRGGGRSFGR